MRFRGSINRCASIILCLFIAAVVYARPACPDALRTQPDSLRSHPDALRTQPDSLRSRPDASKAQPTKDVRNSSGQAKPKSKKQKLLRGFDGGMMLHTGYLSGNINAIGYQPKGAPLGIGGAIHLHLGNHFRVGTEGYMSQLNQRHNGSYLKYGWGGLLADAYIRVGRFQPYAGLTLGGGAATTLLMFEEPSTAWAPIDGTYYQKQAFFAVDPYIGCDYVVSSAFHITLKVDYLCPVARTGLMTNGPRIYFGFLFYH